MKYSDLAKEIQSKNIKPIYFLSGDESYFIDLISNYFEEKFLPVDSIDFNLSIMYGKDVSSRDIISAAKRFPMMADKQVVIVKEAQQLRDVELISSYVDNPLSSTVLVLCYKNSKLDKRKAWVKKLSSSSFVSCMESNKLYENQVPIWISSYAKKHSFNISKKAIALLCESIGNDLSRMHNELEKLRLNVKNGDIISDSHVEKYVGISKEYNVFELYKAIGNRNIEKINRIIEYYIGNSKDASLIMIISMLYTYYTAILSYSFITNKKNKNIVASEMGVSPYFVDDYIAATKIYTPRKIVKNIEILREFDLKAKGEGVGSLNGGELLLEMMYKLIH